MGEHRAPDMVGYHGLDRSESPFAARIADLEAEIARKNAALRECQSALAMVIAPDAIKQTTALNAFAAATAAEASARTALSKATTPETGGTP